MSKLLKIQEWDAPYWFTEWTLFVMNEALANLKIDFKLAKLTAPGLKEMKVFLHEECTPEQTDIIERLYNSTIAVAWLRFKIQEGIIDKIPLSYNDDTKTISVETRGSSVG